MFDINISYNKDSLYSQLSFCKNIKVLNILESLMWKINDGSYITGFFSSILPFSVSYSDTQNPQI